MKKVLVTGGAGFLGSHLCRALLDKGYLVTSLDNFYTGSKKNLSNCINHENFNSIEHDVSEPIDMDVDIIFNLASPASPIHYQKDPIYTAKTNIFGAYNMLNLAKKNNAVIFQASTSEIYGDPETHPQVESYWGNVNPIGIRSCYDESKRCAETLFFDYHRMYNLDIRVVRIFNTYGPHMSIEDGRVVTNLIIQALKNNELTINGDGSQTRSFCYVSDLIEGFIRFIEQPQRITGPINLGNPHEITINELAKKIITLTGSKSRIEYTVMPQDDPLKRNPDISLAKQHLDWEPKVSLEDGLEETISYFSSVIK